MARNDPWRSCLMPGREPLQHGVFEDEESVRRYAQGITYWMPRIARSFAAIMSRWEMDAGTVLDLGSGTGILSLELAKAFPELEFVGLDLSEAAVSVAREQAAESPVGDRVSYERGDAQEMPFDDRSFDLVVSSNTLHLLNNPVAMFSEVQRVLGPPGRFIVSDFRRSWLGYLTPHIRAAYSPDEVESLLQESRLLNWQIKNGLLWLTVLSRT
jgi:ubiquinone/menaquinone biosynthesis C-methylase UbiE